MTTPNENEDYDFARSSEIQELLKAATDGGIDTELLREILWLITAHTKLIGFLWTARRLKEILLKISDEWPQVLEEIGIDSWQPVLEWILDNRDQLEKSLGADFARKLNTSKHNPILGSASASFPMYTVLCEPLPGGPAGSHFLLLSAHLLISYILSLRENSSLEDFEKRGSELKWTFSPNSVSTAARAVRRYAMAVNHPLLQSMTVTLPPEDFADYLADAEEPSDMHFAADHRGLVRFLEKCHGLREWNDTTGGGGGSGGGGGKWIGDRFEAPKMTIEKYQQDPDVGEEDQWGSIETVRFQSGSSKSRKERLKSGLHPEEGETEEEVLLSDFDCGITKQDPGSLVRAAHAKARHIAKHNQVFSWTYDTLADAEIGDLLTRLADSYATLQATQPWTQVQISEAETLLFLQVTLWTGCDIERAGTMEIRHAQESFVDGDATQLIVMPSDGTTDRMHWRIKALAPTYASSVTGDPGQFRPSEKFIDLPDVVGMASQIKTMIELPRSSKKVDRRLFQETSEQIVKAAKAWLTKYYPNGRITLQKIESTLWSKLHRHTGDAALASCTISDKHRLASVRLHYTSPWVKDLQQYYTHVVQSMLDLAKSTVAQPSGAKPWLSLSQFGAVGARLCPTKDAVLSMFERLHHDVTAASKYVDRTGFIKYHNLFTLWTVQMFAYSTTCRAIKTPYLPLTSICSSNELASLSDKDDEFRHKTRLVWIPPVLQRQMQSYNRHLDRLRTEPIRGNSKIMQEPCFFLDEGYQCERVRPKTLEPLLEKYIEGLAANTHRRFLRTELLERGCVPEVVDAFMGHWQCGEEPFGAWSSFDFDHYIIELRSHLEPLLRDIGLTKTIQSQIGN